MTNSAQECRTAWKTIRSVKEKQDDLYFEHFPRPRVELGEVHEAVASMFGAIPMPAHPLCSGVSNRVPEGEADAAGVVGDCSGAGRRGRVVL